MDRERQVRSQCRHFNGQHTLSNELTGPAASNTDAQDPARRWIEDEFGDAIVAVKSRGPAGGSPGKAGHLNGTSLLLGLGFGQTTPGNLRVSEHDCRDRVRRKRHLVPSNGFDGNATFVGGFVGEHRFASYVPDGIDGRLSGAALCIDRNKSAWRDLDAGVLKAQTLGIRTTTHGD